MLFILQVAPGHDVVEHAHALEQRQVLEGARHAHLGHLARVHVPEGLAAEGDGALLRLVDAVDAVEHRALAGAVGADDGAHLVLAHVEADVGQRLDAAEAQADVLHVEDDVADAPARRSPSARALRRCAIALGSTVLRVMPPSSPAGSVLASTIFSVGRDACRCGRPRT